MEPAAAASPPVASTSKTMITSSISCSSTAATELPLSTALYCIVPSHPLVSLLTAPVLSRVASLEHALLLSSLSQLLQRLPGVGSKSVLLMVLLTAGAAVGKWRAQWRGVMTALGVGEAIGRGLILLDELENGRGEEQQHDVGAKDESKLSTDRIRAEIKHLLCFWLLFASTSVAERWLVLPRSLSSTNPLLRLSISSRRQIKSWMRDTRAYLAPILTPLMQRAMLLLREQMDARLPTSFTTFRFPSLPTALLPLVDYLQSFLSSSSTKLLLKRTIPPHPQPIPISASSFAQSVRPVVALPELCFSSPARYELAKLVMLWTALRRKGIGAAVLWDWILAPVVAAVAGSRSSRNAKGAGKGKKIFKVVMIEQEEQEDSMSGTRRIRRQHPFISPTPSSNATSTSSTRRMPMSSTPNEQHRRATFLSSSSSSSSRDANDDEEDRQGGEEGHDDNDDALLSPDRTSYALHPHHASAAAAVIATPDIPYRLTSLHHPIHARIPSSSSSGTLLFDNHPSATLPSSASSSPTKQLPSTSLLGGYAMDLNGRNFATTMMTSSSSQGSIGGEAAAWRGSVGARKNASSSMMAGGENRWD